MGSWHRMLHLRQMHAAGRRGIDSWTRLDTTSCQSPGYVIFKRILPMDPDMDHLCGSACITKHMKLHKRAQRKQHKTILDRWNRDGKYRKSLSDVGWTEESLIQYDEIAFEDHSLIATRQERSRNEKSGKLLLNAEGTQGPLNQRSDFRNRHAKYCAKSIQQSLEVETNLSLQSKTSPTKAPSTVWTPWGIRLSTRSFYRMAILSFFHNAFIFVITMATKQRLVVNVDLGLVEIFILDWTVYFFKNCSSDVISLARNLISWQSTGV